MEVKGELSVVSTQSCGSAALLETVELAIRQLAKRWLAEQEFAKVDRQSSRSSAFQYADPGGAGAHACRSEDGPLGEDQTRYRFAEIDKDLTKHPVYEIERHLTGGERRRAAGGVGSKFGVDPGQCSRPVEALASAANLKRRLSWRHL
jgi:hypothetical protein